MRKTMMVLALSGTLLAGGPAASQGATRDMILRGHGAALGCAAWLELRESADGLFASSKRESYRGTVGWALGYLSGAARFGQDMDPLRSMGEEATIDWVVAYCRSNPAQGFRNALEAFIEAHPPP